MRASLVAEIIRSDLTSRPGGAAGFDAVSRCYLVLCNVRPRNISSTPCLMRARNLASISKASESAGCNFAFGAIGSKTQEGRNLGDGLGCRSGWLFLPLLVQEPAVDRDQGLFLTVGQAGIGTDCGLDLMLVAALRLKPARSPVQPFGWDTKRRCDALKDARRGFVEAAFDLAEIRIRDVCEVGELAQRQTRDLTLIADELAERIAGCLTRHTVGYSIRQVSRANRLHRPAIKYF